MEKKQEDIIKTVYQVKHPAVDMTLKDLGILKDITFKEDTFFILLAFPFPNIPIKDQLTESVCEPVKKLDFKCIVEAAIMSEEEKQDFLQKEGQAWKGL
ncbi:MAG: metal-sulfur cluster biosynthetic enzyme [Candidatus Thermoplasmatota archaeon]|nr:metal-sulfur cluster biosynthetic enzyme [Candidatus Thermoplasmatota archaeon]